MPRANRSEDGMKESFCRNRKGILMMVLSSFCACVGQLFWKMSEAYGLPVLLLGFCFYGFGALIMLMAYKYGKLSVLQPVLSLNYVLSLILGAVILQEQVTLLKCAGILIIIAGVVSIAGGDET